MALKTIVGLFRIPSDDPELMRAQLEAFSRQVPLLYFILLVSSLALAWTHYEAAPRALTIVFPLFLAVLCLTRVWIWLRSRAKSPSEGALVRRLRTTVWLTAGFGVAFLTWSLSLFPYGDAYAQSHVVFYIGITVVSCIFCLMHLRPAALTLTCVVVFPFTLFFAWTGRPAFVAIALNMLLVAAAMTYILLTYSRDFANMIGFQRKLIETFEAEKESARARAEAERAAQQEIVKHAGRFEVAMNNMQHGLCMFDANDRLIVCNERYGAMYGLPPELTRPGAEWSDIVAHRLTTLGYRGLELSDVIQQHRQMNLSAFESVGTRELMDGRTIFVRTRPLREGGWVGTHEDISERRGVESRLSHMARHDALTGLANRLHFGEKKDQAVAGLARGKKFAILCIDLDRFKQANDALGHAVGDAVLREVAERLRSCLREIDTAARIGGDEFAILQADISGPEQPDDLARRLLGELTRPYEIDNHRIHVGASIGIALAPKDETVGPLLLRLADVALYRAKTEGRGTYRFFEATMDSEVQARRRLELDLRQALIDGALELYYQPINDALTRAIRGFEALARWRHPELGMISPATFIPVAEQTGLIVALGEWALRAACQEAARWPGDVRVSVNLSARQFKSNGLTAMVRKALSDARLAPRRLELEITESVLLDGGGGNLAMLHELRDLGVRIAMDDFGTGYSSLSYLRSFPFDKIKIDQSFVRNIDQRDAREIVRAVAGLGRTLGMTTTAEGVETEAQLEAMIAYQCTEVQGYLFSQPVPAMDLPELFNKFREMREVA